MNPITALLTQLNLPAFVATLPAKIEKDEQRMQMFGLATAKKSMEIGSAVAANLQGGMVTIKVGGADTVATVDHAEAFAKELAAVFGEYEQDAEHLAPKKWSIASLFGHSDPFSHGRSMVRDLAHKWDYDADFVTAMG